MVSVVATHFLRVQTKIDLLKGRVADLRKLWEESKHPRGEHGRFSEARLGGKTSPVQIELLSSRRELRGIANAVVDKLNFPRHKIVIGSKAGAVFWRKLFGGKLPWGTYNVLTENITIHQGVEKLNKPMIEGIISHEVTHAKFARFLKDALREEKKAIAENPYKYSGAPHRFDEEAAAKYPAFVSYMQNLVAPASKLLKDDGVTNYSGSYWKKTGVVSWRLGDGTGALLQGRIATEGRPFRLAVNETLAEIARMRVQSRGKWSRVKPSRAWIRLYDSIDQHWGKVNA